MAPMCVAKPKRISQTATHHPYASAASGVSRLVCPFQFCFFKERGWEKSEHLGHNLLPQKGSTKAGNAQKDADDGEISRSTFE